MTLRQARQAEGMTITKLAAGADMSASTVSMLETGRLNMRADEARRLADALGVEPGAVDELREAVGSDAGAGKNQAG